MPCQPRPDLWSAIISRRISNGRDNDAAACILVDGLPDLGLLAVLDGIAVVTMAGGVFLRSFGHGSMQRSHDGVLCVNSGRDCMNSTRPRMDDSRVQSCPAFLNVTLHH